MTRSTSSGVNTPASTPIPIRSASRSPATTCCPGLATPAILHRRKTNLTPLGLAPAGTLMPNNLGQVYGLFRQEQERVANDINLATSTGQQFVPYAGRD